MPTKSPFFIKRYISNDIEQGGVSKWFWFYPSDSLQLEHGAIGMFFEVTYSVSADSYLEEHLIKLVWDFFTDAYYDNTVILTGLNRFKLAVKKSIQRLISLVEESGISEGIDVNILYVATISHSDNPHKSKIYLARVGEMDVFLIRQNEHLSLQNIIPDNDLVKPILAGVGELEKNDIVLIGNRELIGTSLDSSMIDFATGWHTLLDSLNELQSNLFGNKQVIVLGFPEYKDINLDQYNKIDSNVNKQSLSEQKANNKTSIAKEIPVQIVSSDTKLTNSWRSKIQSFIKLAKVKTKIMLSKLLPLGQQFLLKGKSLLNKKRPSFSQIDKKNPATKPTPKSKLDQTEKSTPTINSTTFNFNKPSTSIITNVSPKISSLQNKSAPLIKSSTPQKLTEKKDPSVKDTPPPNKIIDVTSVENISASSFRLQHSASGKLWVVIQQNFGLAFQHVLNLLPLVGKSKILSKLYGVGKVPQTSYKSNNLFRKNKVFLYLVIIIIILGSIWTVTSKISYQKKQNALATEITQYESAYAIEKNQVINQSTDNVFVECMNKADSLTSSILEKFPDFKKPDKEDTKVQNLYLQVQKQQELCQTQYDRYNKISRVQEVNNMENYATVLTDFDVALGSGSKVVDMVYKDNALYVVDQGKKAVYKYNTLDNNALKLEDPQKLITLPTQIAVNQKSGEVYVWDQENGFLEYKNDQEFVRITSGGLDLVGGQVSAMEVFVGNIYYTLEDKKGVYRMDNTSSGFSVGVDYFVSEDFLNISDIIVDGNIYVTLSEYTKQSFYKYYGGKKDPFSFVNEGSYQLGAIEAGYTGVQENQPLYVFDKDQQTIVAIEKPSPKNHPGKGIFLYRIVYGGTRENAWQNVKEIVLSVDANNQEQGIYVLDGSLLWRIELASLITKP